jgi:hypothetical protein
MLQRALAQDRINRCGSDESEDEVDFSSSPTQMAVGNGEALLRRVRGTVVGNVLLVGCLATAGFAAGKVLHLRGVSRTMREAEAELGLPGKVWMPLSMLLVPTLSAAVSLLAGNNRSTTDASDVVVALFGMVLCGTALLGALWLTTGSRFKARAVHSDAAREFGTAAKRFTFREASLHGFRHWMIYQLSGQWEWVDRREPLFVDRWGELFDGNIRGRHWFISVDIAASILTALLAGLTAAENASCGTLQVLSVIFDVGYFVCLYNLRPYSAPHDTALALGNAAATCCSSLLGVFGVDTSAVTAAQAAINVISIAVGFAALAAEGRAVAFVDRFVLVVQAVGRRLPLRSRRGRGHGGFSTASHAGQPLDLPEQCRLLEQLVTTYVQRRAHHTTADLDISGSLEKMVRVICSDVTLRRRAEEPIA